MHCWNCRHALGELKKISFRAECDKCMAALHCCQNCKYYKPGLPNDCAVPGTDFIRDRKAMNFCEEFSPLGQAPLAKKEDSKKRFDDLFK